MTVEPIHVMEEIEKAIVRVGIAKQYFTIKTLTPVYPAFKEKLTDATYYEDRKWTIKESIKQEKQVKKQVDAVLYSFKYRGQFKKSSILSHLDGIPDNFNLNHEYLSKLTLVDDKEYKSTEIDGRLWLRELFLTNQANSATLPMLSITVLSLALTLTWFIEDFIGESKSETRVRSSSYWAYTICMCILV